MNQTLDPDKEKQVQDWLAANMGPAPDTGEPPAPPPMAIDTQEKNDASNEKVVDSHPATQPDELDKYIKGQEVQADKWGPDKEAAVMDSVRKGFKNPGFLLSEGAAGLGDAIMQGVARAGSSNFLNTVEKNKENTIKNASDELAHLQESNLKNMGVKQGLEAQRPGSAINKSATPVLEATLKAMMPKEKQNLIPALLSDPTQARKAIDQLKDFIPAEMKEKLEGEMKILELQFQQQNAMANRAIAEQGRKNEETKTKQSALEDLSKMPWYSRLMHPGIAGALKEQAGLNAPSIPQYSDNLPSGTTYQAPDGTIRRKK